MEIAKSYIFFKRNFSLLTVIFVGVSAMLSACTSDLGEKFSRNNIDVNAYGKTQEDIQANLLQKYVDSDRFIRYAAWKKSSQDLVSLKSVLSAMTKADITGMSAEGKKAFYINAYNMMTIDLILTHYDESLGGTGSPYPTERSIRNINNLDDKVWDFFKWQIGGQSVSLNDVENKILRPMGDARIHFAIVCASKGCPPILNTPITEQTLNKTLDQLSDEFINSGRDTKFKISKNEIKTSRILDWFSQDFINGYGSVKNFIAKYSHEASEDQIQGMTIKYTIYDWLLNESLKPVDTPVIPEIKPAPESKNEPCANLDSTGKEAPHDCAPPVETGSGSEEPPLN